MFQRCYIQKCNELGIVISLEANTVLQLPTKTEELTIILSVVLELAPSTEGNYHGSRVVVARVVQRLVCEKLGGFLWSATTLNSIDHFAIVHDVADTIRCQNQESVPSMFDLISSRIWQCNDTMGLNYK